MISTIRSRIPERRAAGFTLVELMIGATIGGGILIAVLSTFLFLGRSAANLRNYNDMEAQGRKALEQFAEDTRQASAVTWASSSSLTLVVNASNITYAYASGTLTRQVGTGTPAKLLSGITTFSFVAYAINGGQITDFSTVAARLSAGKSTKQIQISLEASRTSQTVSTATNTVLSARFILRNKRVTT